MVSKSQAKFWSIREQFIEELLSEPAWVYEVTKDGTPRLYLYGNCNFAFDYDDSVARAGLTLALQRRASWLREA